MAVNVKMGVDTSGFKSGIADANAQLKTFDAQLKFAQTSMKQAGNAEQGMVTATNALTGKLSTQRSMLQQYTAQMERLRSAGVDPLSREYQKLETAMLNVRTGMLETEAALNDLNTGHLEAAGSADKLVQSVNSIGKKISLDQVIGGINTITGGMEKAAQKAVQLGETIWTNVMNSAKWADDTATMALMYGIDLDTFLRMQKLVTNGMDTSVDAMLTAQDKLKKGVGGGTDAVMDQLRQLGLLESIGTKYAKVEVIPEDSTKLFWDAGQAIMALGDAYEKENAAQTLFGRGWKELVPLFSTFRSMDEYEEALQGVNVESEEEVNALAELNDKVSELKGNLETLSHEVWAAMAPALTEAATALNGVLDSVLKYLDTPKGQEMLERLGSAVSGLFEDLGNIDPEKVVENFVTMFEKVTGSFEWIETHWDAVKAGLMAIAGAFGAMKIATLSLNIKKAIDGFRDLLGGGGGDTGAQTPTVVPGTGTKMSVLQQAAALGLTGAVALGPAFIAAGAANIIPNQYKITSPERVKAGTYTSHEVELLREWVGLQNELVEIESKFGTNEFDENRYAEVTEAAARLPVQGSEIWNRYMAYMKGTGKTVGRDTLPTEVLDEIAAGLVGTVQTALAERVVKVLQSEENISGRDPYLMGLKDLDQGQKTKVLNALHGEGDMLNTLIRYWNGEEMDALVVEALKRNVQTALAKWDMKLTPEMVEPKTTPAPGGPPGQLITDPEEIKKHLAGEYGVAVPVTPEPIITWNEDIIRQVGPVPLPVTPVIEGISLGQGLRWLANKGYSGGTYSSNLYVENMHMGGNADAEALAAAMAAHQQRLLNGFGNN